MRGTNTVPLVGCSTFFVMCQAVVIGAVLFACRWCQDLGAVGVFGVLGTSGLLGSDGASFPAFLRRRILR